jgi:hypothetical protein
VIFPLAPETMVRRRTADRLEERLEFVAALDDRLGERASSTADTISALATLGGDVIELSWGSRRFRVYLAELTVTETAFGKNLAPIAATIKLAFDVVPVEEDAVSVTVAGERWRQVPDLGKAGPNDLSYEVSVEDEGSLAIRFGDGRHGARPPAGEVLVRARYRIGGARPARDVRGA